MGGVPVRLGGSPFSVLLASSLARSDADKDEVRLLGEFERSSEEGYLFWYH